MDQIEHAYVTVGGLKLHVAQTGKGDKGVVLFVHGFPEIWYSWRYQMLAVAEAGYRAVAPDHRGYGLSEQPEDAEKAADWSGLVDDLLGILDSFHFDKVFLVAKDFGCRLAYMFALRHPSRVSGVVSLGIPYSPRVFTPELLPEGFYIRRWREPGRAERDFGRFDVKTVARNIYILFASSEVPIAREGQEIMDMVDPDTPLPYWFTDEDLAAYAALYEKSGFRFPLQMPYRSLAKLSTEAQKPDPKLQAPTLLVVGGKDYFNKFPGVDDYIKGEDIKHYMTNLHMEVMPDGSHFIQEQSPNEVNQLIISFLRNHS